MPTAWKSVGSMRICVTAVNRGGTTSTNSTAIRSEAAVVARIVILPRQMTDKMRRKSIPATGASPTATSAVPARADWIWRGASNISPTLLTAAAQRRRSGEANQRRRRRVNPPRRLNGKRPGVSRRRRAVNQFIRG